MGAESIGLIECPAYTKHLNPYPEKGVFKSVTCFFYAFATLNTKRQYSNADMPVICEIAHDPNANPGNSQTYCLPNSSLSWFAQEILGQDSVSDEARYLGNYDTEQMGQSVQKSVLEKQ